MEDRSVKAKSIFRQGNADDDGWKRESMIIQTQSLVKTYRLGERKVPVLGGIDLQVEEGEIVAGEDVSRLTPNRLAEIRNRRIGFVFQSFNLLARLDALENVELPLLYAGASEAKDRAKEALQIVGLVDRMHHEPAQLSGGERQRAAIARAIVTDPAIILADEPTGNLDSKTGEGIMVIFKELNANGRTIIIVTHEPAVSNHCRRQIHIRDGKIINQKRSG